MPTLSYAFEPNQSIYVIATVSDGALAVRPAVVLRVRADMLITGTTLVYDVRFDGQTSTTETFEEDMFATLEAAIVEYEVRLS